MAGDDPTGSTEAPGAAQIFRLEGEYWTIAFDGVTCRLRDVRGLQHLASLLTHPHEPISALVLERNGADPTEDTPAGPVRINDSRERARVNVTRAIAAALKRISAHHPDLGAHLATTIRTGTFCAYRPDPRLQVPWTQ